MLARSVADQTVNKAPLKKSLFSKPSWSNAQNLESTDLFHRSDHAYKKSADEIERERKRRLAKRQKEREQTLQREDRSPKRQKISAEEGDDDDEDDDDDEEEEEEEEDDDVDGGDRKASKQQSGREKSEKDISAITDGGKAIQSTIENPLQQVPSLSPQMAAFSPTNGGEDTGLNLQVDEQKASRKYATNVIDIEGDDDRVEPEDMVSPPPKHPVILEIADDELLSDEEFPELARKAREKARRLRLQQNLPGSPSPESSQNYSDVGLSGPGGNKSSTKGLPPDPVIKILIGSNIPQTRQLIVNRKLGQRLKDVRLAWIDRQGLNHMTDDIFLTWKGKRLFDVTTCKGLGVRVDTFGQVLLQGDVIEDTDGHLQIEAVTKEIFEANKRARRDRVVRSEEADEEKEPQGSPEESEERRMRLTLKSKGYPDMKVNVEASTLMSKVLGVFRTKNKIGAHRETFLHFDGDRLEPNMQMADTELSDFDFLDVYVK